MDLSNYLKQKAKNLLSYTFYPKYSAVFVKATFFIISIIALTGCSKALEPEPVKINIPNLNKLGYGNDITRDNISASSTTSPIIDVESFYRNNRDRIIIDSSSKQGYSDEIYAENALDYALQFKAKVKFGLPIFKPILSASYSDTRTFSSKEVYSRYKVIHERKRIHINATNEFLQKYLTNSFKEDIATQSAEYIVKNYGTHLLKGIVLGGIFEASYSAQTSNSNRRVAAQAGISIPLKNFFKFNLSSSFDVSIVQKNTNEHLYFKTTGGDPSVGFQKEVNLSSSNISGTIDINGWQQSVNKATAELIDVQENGLIPINQLIADPIKAKEVENYIAQYLLDRQVTLEPLPPAVFEYYDYNLGRHAYSLSDVPTIYGTYSNVGSVFSVQNKSISGAVEVYEFYSAEKNDRMYTRNRNPNAAGYAYVGVTFYAFPTQIAGTVPVYEYYYEKKSNKKMYYDHYYSTTKGIPQGDPDWHYIEIAFYAYP
ncbi:MAC/perforin domain-containing protein [Arcicella rosea]|uniref:MACPF domain-containing protein n=1 Tax=Arcicella rosea TaxID=502909 RepID=A0A841EBJ8_9BACT|nr:MAC/perforin domain-containing protein [Arcicella rosea]MBB6001447.1 hypothetical protein [Arcicella rosea]